MQNKSKNTVLLVIIIILLVVGLVYVFFNNSKQKENNLENKDLTTLNTNSCTSDKGSVMTYQRALEIAETSSCAKIGTFTGEYGCNQNAGGLVDVYMKPSDKPSCGFACRISIDTEKAEEGWMCVGAL